MVRPIILKNRCLMTFRRIILIFPSFLLLFRDFMARSSRIRSDDGRDHQEFLYFAFLPVIETFSAFCISFPRFLIFV
jgi:hypothetical protein